MLNLFGKRKDPYREQVRAQFDSITGQLRTADEMSQMAVGHAIDMANTFFLQRFGSIAAFSALSKPNKIEYIHSLSSLEEKLAASDPHSSLGTTLFKMFVGALVENDAKLVEHFSEELAFFSRKTAFLPA